MIEPMIEPIFVILGILASVAIPRLAATREDAEISAAVANLRTLISDAGAYYTVTGTFNGAAWNQITNVPLKKGNGDAATAAATATPTTVNGAYLKVGDTNDCIGVHLVNKAANTNIPAYIKFTKKQGAAGVCAQVLGSKPVKAYLDSRVAGVNGPNGASTIAIGSNTKIY